MTSRADKPILVPMGQKDTLNEKLDESVEESVPLNDAVSLEHNDLVCNGLCRMDHFQSSLGGQNSDG